MRTRLWRLCGGIVLVLCLAASLGHAQSQLVNASLVIVGSENFCTDAGATDAYACNLLETITTYVTGARYAFKANTANTGAATLALNGLAAKTLKKRVGGTLVDLDTNDIGAGALVVVQYDGTVMQLVSFTLPQALTTSAAVQFGSLTLGIPLAVAQGGTGSSTTPTSGRYLKGTGSAWDTSAGAASGVGTCTNQFVTGLSSDAAPTCANAVLSSAQFANQGTTTTLLHGNASGNPSFGAVSLTADVTNRLPYANVTAATAASRLLGRGSASSGDWQEISLGTALALSGTTLDVTTVASLYVPAGSMEVEGGCAVNAAAVLVTTGPKLTTISCTDADADGIDFDWVMPDSWTAGTITVELNAFSTGNNNGEVLEMRFSGQCVRDGDPVAAWSVTSGSTATSSSNVAASMTWGNAANREQHATTAALTLGGTCAGGAHVYMHAYINSSGTTLSPMTDGKILGAKVEYARVGAD